MKKMSVLILSDDSDYRNNVIGYFRKHYNNEVLIAGCTALENISEYIRNNNISIILADEELYSAAKTLVGEKTTVCHLVSGKSSGEDNTVSKYISAPLLYNELLFIYSKIISDTKSCVGNANSIYTFISVNGCGATTLSASFARRLASEGKKVLYLGLDGLSNYNAAFLSPSERGLSDIILALKSKGANIPMTAKSVTFNDGVAFIDKCRCADDFYELNDEETELLFDGIISSDDYDAVVMDISFAYTNIWNYISKYSSEIICVSTNRSSAIAKTNSFIETVKIRDVRNSTEAFSKLSVIVNRTASQQLVAELGCERIGFLQRYTADDYKTLTDKISHDELWKNYIKG